MSEEDIEERIVEQLEECAGYLLSCEVENKSCSKCRKKDKENCLKFIRSVLASLCKIQVAQFINITEEKVPETLYA